MSFCIHNIKNNDISVKYEERKTPYFSSKWENDNEINIFEGEFHDTEKKFHQKNWREEYKKINDSFVFVSINKKSLEIEFITSKYGLENLFYFYDGHKFILSDDFWEIANLVCQSKSDIDVNNVKEAANGCYPILYGTYLKNVYFVAPAHYGKFNPKTGLIQQEYFEIKYTPNENTLQEISQKLDEFLVDAINKIYKECGDVKYIYGLSGGLDSRLLSYYTKKLNCESFIIGDVKPHKILLAKDHKNARKISKIYGQKHTECSWNKKIFDCVKEMDIRNNPMGGVQFFKGQIDICADVLLSGGNGYIVGSAIPQDIDKFDSQKLAKYLMVLGRDFIPKTQKSLHIEKAIKYITKKDIVINGKEKWFDKIYSKELEEQMLKKLSNYIIQERSKGKNNLDIYTNYFHNILGARNKFGGFESLSGTIRSFSIYNPHIFLYSLSWPWKALNNRLALKELIKEKMPQTYAVGEQRYEGRIDGKKQNIFFKIFNVFMFILRGNGSEMCNSKFKYVRKDFVKDMNLYGNWFFDIFHIKNDIFKISRFDNKYAILKFWKIKLILDKLENKDYKKYLSKSEFVSIKGEEKNV